MTFERTLAETPSRWQRMLSVFAMVLVLFGSTLSVTHSHQNTLDDHASAACSLCVVAHATAQVAHAPAIVVVSQVFADMDTVAPVARPRTFIHVAHLSRPPPALVVLA
jgi:hypothetical protein